jgi:hypothetical protein
MRAADLPSQLRRPLVSPRSARTRANPVTSAATLAAIVMAVTATACSGDDGDEALTTVAAVATATSDSTAVGSTEPLRPGPIPNVAGDGQGPSVEDQLAAATIPLAPEDCRSADVIAVTEVIGTEVAFTIGQLDPSGRSLCRYVDVDESTLVRVLVTGAAGDPTAAESFAELSADPAAVMIDETTVQVGRLAARLDGALVEVAVEPDAVADDAAAGDAAVSLLAVVAG